MQGSFAQALALHQQGRLADAERLYEEILKQQPNHFGALHLLGVVSIQTQRTQRGVDLISRAIELNGRVADAHSNLGTALLDLRRFDDALDSIDRAIALKPDFALAHDNRAIALAYLDRHEDALASCDKAISLEPGHVEAHVHRGNSLRELQRFEEALASLDRAIALKPSHVDAHAKRGNVLADLKRYDEALQSYDRAGASAGVCYSRGYVLQVLKRFEEAIASYDQAIAMKPDFVEAYNNRATALTALKRYAEALVSRDKAVALRSGDEELYANRGRLLASMGRYHEALPDFDKAFALNPDLADIEADRLNAKSLLCDWANYDAELVHLLLASDTRGAAVSPFFVLSRPASAEEQLHCAKRWTAKMHPPSDNPVWRGERYNHDRIRLGYFSSDFFAQATAYLAVGMFECHDRSRFETVALSWAPDDRSSLRRRVEAAFDRFVDVQKLDDDEVAGLIRKLEIDILVDLAGLNTGTRVGVLGRRPAPIQATYLGFPGTIGAPFIDYIIADRIVIPEQHRQFYTEKVVTLPDSYQANDDKRAVADRALTRAEMGLPPTGFVFCCFNNTFKITPEIFDRWMRILREVEGSVLWLLEANAGAADNLRREAAARGVAGDRLVFAKRMPPPDHLARHRLAGLFLDTLPCNAHTTASDALWAGLPVLTCLGETFAGRVAASLLHAIDLSELIVETPEAYERMAIDLATHPDKLATIKAKLAANRSTTPLFDTRRFTRHIEAAYVAMHERHRVGLAPADIVAG